MNMVTRLHLHISGVDSGLFSVHEYINTAQQTLYYLKWGLLW